VTSIKNLIDFFKDAYNELKHVSWLTRNEMIASTVVVVIVVGVMSVYIVVVDRILQILLIRVWTV